MEYLQIQISKMNFSKIFIEMIQVSLLYDECAFYNEKVFIFYLFILDIQCPAI